jgi:dipeptidyl aminopeptidase/acylaminoacyl peptidase
MVAVVRSFSDRDPGLLLLYRADVEPAQRLSLISRARRDLDTSRMASIDFQRIKARDGREIPVWLTVPPGRKAGDKGPAVVMVHGGPWVRGGHWRWKPMEQFLASRGYVVVSPEFRGSTGYGSAHFRAGWKQWGRAMQDDVADAARWAIAQGWADRLCIAGASYGGYATYMGLVNDPDLYKCGVAWVGVADPFLYLEGSWWVRDDISGEGRRYDLKAMVGDAERDRAALEAVSPVVQAARIKTPLLMAYGEADKRVPIQHGERLRKAMRAAGAEPEWISYPTEGHSWIKLETKVDFARRFEAFLDKHLKQ